MTWIHVILVTIILSLCSCKDVPMTRPGKNVLHFSEICVGSNVFSTKATHFTWTNVNSKTSKVALDFGTFHDFCDGIHYLTKVR
jgi:hypothetical protein